jgi:hypothetical protein
MSEKIQPQHLARKAMLYVRQSSAFQVTHNAESGKLQYAMQARLRDLGFSEIEVVDEDLGSAAGTVCRSGFERMVAELWRHRGCRTRGDPRRAATFSDEKKFSIAGLSQTSPYRLLSEVMPCWASA